VQDLIRNHQVDIIEMEESYGWSKAVSKLDQIPVVVRLHGPWFLNKRFENRARERWERKAIRSAHFVTAPSQWVLGETTSRYRVSSKKSACIPNMQAVVRSSDRWRLDNCDRESILFVGRFDEIKGGDLVIRAFGVLARNNPKLRLTFVGPDGRICGKNTMDYIKEALSPEINHRVTYLGALTKAEICRLRPKHFLTVSASRFEVFPYAILEAMSFGCPIVAPAIGGIPELLAPPKNGRLFKVGSTEALVEACQFLLDNPDVAARYGDAAFKTCATHFSPTGNALRTAELFQQIAERFRTRKGGAF
jgi:glycosyltransferase involved in cell wall biosynthesis